MHFGHLFFHWESASFTSISVGFRYTMCSIFLRKVGGANIENGICYRLENDNNNKMILVRKWSKLTIFSLVCTWGEVESKRDFVWVSTLLILTAEQSTTLASLCKSVNLGEVVYWNYYYYGMANSCWMMLWKPTQELGDKVVDTRMIDICYRARFSECWF